jgi:hypothetical protein
MIFAEKSSVEKASCQNLRHPCVPVFAYQHFAGVFMTLPGNGRAAHILALWRIPDYRVLHSVPFVGRREKMLEQTLPLLV